MKKLSFIIVLFFSCNSSSELYDYGKHYQQHRDYVSLQKAVDGIQLGVDKSVLPKILGVPIDMGFDYRYLLDSVGPTGCVIGAVFHINENEKIDRKWIGEICE